MLHTSKLISQILYTTPILVVTEHAIIAVRKVIIKTLTSCVVLTQTNVLMFF
jgi:hypothetical protein